MDTTVILVLAVAFSVGVTTLLPRLTGTTVRVGAVGHFLLGIAVGPQVFGVLDAASIQSIQPLLSMLLGVLAFGLGLDVRGRAGALVTAPPRVVSAALVAALTAAGGYLFVVLATGGMVRHGHLLFFGLSFGVMAACTSWQRVVQTAESLRADGPTTRALGSFAMLGLVSAVLMFGAVTAGMRSGGPALGLRELTTLEWWVATVAVGFVCGLLFVTFIGDEESPPRVFLATVGTVIFATGMAAAMGISPLLVNLVVGATVGGFSRHAAALQRVIEGLHHPAYVLLLILVGALWTPPPALLWALIPIYLLLRWAGLHVGTRAASAAAEIPLGSPRFGEGLLAQGAFALAIATNYLQLVPEDGSALVTVAVAAILAEDLVADRLLRRVLADAEEVFVKPDPPSAPEAAPPVDAAAPPALEAPL